VADSSIQSVTTALRVLQAFTHSERVLGVSELARRLGIGKSTAHRMLTTLAAEGFISQTVDGRYRLGMKLWELGNQVVHGLELREVAHASVEALRQRTGEAVHLAVWDGAEIVYVDRFESESTQRVFSRLGTRMPAHATSAGKVLLAFGPDERIERVCAAGLTRLTARTITTRQGLASALERVRAHGFAESIEEAEKGVTSVGAPVFDYQGSVIAGLSVAAPSIRLTRERIPEVGALVRRHAAEISRHMGHRAQ
jgi:DNA-binding IclR family transcriptional regulator